MTPAHERACVLLRRALLGLEIAFHNTSALRSDIREYLGPEREGPDLSYAERYPRMPPMGCDDEPYEQEQDGE